MKKGALKRNYEFVLLEAKTSKQEGDVAGSKLLKFNNHLEKEIAKFFNIKKKGFNYNQKKGARYFFVVKKKSEVIIEGPFMKDEKNLKMFKGLHKRTFYKGGKIYARERVKFNLKNFIINWKIRYKKKIKDMSISDLRVV